MNDSPRHKAREKVLHALYALETGEDTTEAIIDTIIDQEKLPDRAAEFARELFRLSIELKAWALSQISALSENWDIERIALIDLLIMRMAMVEMHKIDDAPVKVVINEAIELSKSYSTGQSFSFVNGILDRFAKLKETREEKKS